LSLEKTQLLVEKEWLLKEVHHRVKNNLQIMMSLLEPQSTQLKDDALLALEDSQRRIYARVECYAGHSHSPDCE
jgi:two-component sensor histidine kinase